MRTYPGLDGEIHTCLLLVEQLHSYVQHFGAAGVRADGQKPGAKIEAVTTLKREFEAMRECLPVGPQIEQPTPDDAA